MLLTTTAAAAYLAEQHGLKRSPRTLQNLRLTGGGPSYCKPSPNECLYRPDDLDAWVASLTARRYDNTAQERVGSTELPICSTN
jgi:hypothetical protein